MLSHEGLILEDVPPFTQYTAFSNKGETRLSCLLPTTQPTRLKIRIRSEHSKRNAEVQEECSCVLHM